MKKWVKVTLIIVILLAIIITGGVFLFVKLMGNYQSMLQYEGVESSVKKELDFSPFEESISSMSEEKYNQIDKILESATVEDIQTNIKQKKFTCEELVTYYLINIKKYDDNKLNSIIELNPDAIKIAKEMDKNIENFEGLLFGIPVVLKDNIGTSDKLSTSAGAEVLRDNKSTEDSTVVKNLRNENAIILGKANMSEWSYYLSSSAPSGFSALGGQTFNPYGKFDVGGSSSGPAVAVSANFATLAVGTETCGSIIYPSGQNSVIGLKPTLGLIPNDNIIPISTVLDTAGPISKNIQDNALLLKVLSKDSEGKYKFDNKNINNMPTEDCKKITIGVIKNTFGNKESKNISKKIIKELQDIGFNVREVELSMDYDKDLKISAILDQGLEKDLNLYLKENSTSKDLTLQKIIDFNNENPEVRIPYGQDLLEGGITVEKMSQDELNKTIEKSRESARIVLDEQLSQCDAIVSFGNELSTYYATAGYPAISVPAGYKNNNEPIGVTFIGDEYSEEHLLSIAMTYENATKHRKNPDYKNLYK